jgi:putative MATE family efflux protein
MVKTHKNEVDMLKTPVFKGILKMTLPIMIMNVCQSLYNIVDMTMLRVMVNDDAVGSVGASSTLISLITGLLIGLSSGANVVIARHVAKKDVDNVQKSVGTALLVGLVGGLLVMVIGVCFAELFLSLMNCPLSLFDDAVLYFRIYFLGVPVLMFYNVSAAILRSTGDTKRPMYFLLLSGAIKVLLNFLILKFTDSTVEGAGIATIASWLVTGMLCFLVLVKTNSIVKINFRKIRFYKSELLSILHIGIPAGLQTATYAIGNVIIASTVNTFGAEATKGISIANTFDGLIYQIVNSPSLAVMPFVSQNASAGKYNRVMETVIKASIITASFGLIFGLTSAYFSNKLCLLMSPNPAVIEYAGQKMKLISRLYFICGVQDVLCGAFRGIKKPVYPTVVSFFFTCVLRLLWVAFIFPLYPNLTFLYLVWPIGWTLAIISLLAVFIPEYKKQKRKFET